MEIRELLALLANSEQGKAAIAQSLERAAENERHMKRWIADAAADDGVTSTVSTTTDRMSATVRAQGETVIVDWADPWRITMALETFGLTVEYTPPFMPTVTKVAKTRRTPGGLVDHRSRVAPIVGSAIGIDDDAEMSARFNVPWRMADALHAFGYSQTTVHAVWHAIDVMRREGFTYRTDSGTTHRTVTQVVAARARDAAHDKGREWNTDRVDDVLSEATLRTYETLHELIHRARTGDPTVSGTTVYVAAPDHGETVVAEFIGWNVTRKIRCGACAYCQHTRGSRYTITGCVAPKTIVEWTTAQRVYARAIRAAARASLSDERFRWLTEDGITPDVTLPDTPITVCGHGAACNRPACIGRKAIAAAVVWCEATGVDIVAGNGFASRESVSTIARLFGNEATPTGRRHAMTKLRSLITRAEINHRDGSEGTECVCTWDTQGHVIRVCSAHGRGQWAAMLGRPTDDVPTEAARRGVKLTPARRRVS